MCSVAYKKQGTPNWRLLTSILCFLHVQHHIQKARGSRLTSPIDYHLILFVHIELTDPDWRIIVLFIHSNHRCMESKGHIYIYIYQVFNEINSYFYKLIIVHYSIDKNYKVSELLLSPDSARLEKSHKNTIRGQRHMHYWLMLPFPCHQRWSPCEESPH
jgi:hypothetical protein